MSGEGKALVTIAIGDDYRRMWERVFAPTLRRYALRHGYALVVIEDYLDGSPAGQRRSPHWQKLLIAEHPEVRRHEHAVWIDADIMVNFHAAPCIVGATPAGGIGVVSHKAMYADPARLENRWDRAWRNAAERFAAERGPSPPERYAQAGLPDDLDDMTNTGVLVIQPARDAAFLRHVYDDYFARYGENPMSANEQMALSYALFKEGRARPIDPRFNVVWTEEFMERYPFLYNKENRRNRALIAYCVNAAFHNAYFLHFLADGYSRSDAELVMPDLDDIRALVVR